MIMYNIVVCYIIWYHTTSAPAQPRTLSPVCLLLHIGIYACNRNCHAAAHLSLVRDASKVKMMSRSIPAPFLMFCVLYSWLYISCLSLPLSPFHRLRVAGVRGESPGGARRSVPGAFVIIISSSSSIIIIIIISSSSSGIIIIIIIINIIIISSSSSSNMIIIIIIIIIIITIIPPCRGTAPRLRRRSPRPTRGVQRARAAVLL